VVQGVVRIDVFGLGADQDRKLNFVMAITRMGWDDDRATFTDNRAGRLDEDYRFVGDLAAEFPDVFDVIAADTDNFANRDVFIAKLYGMHIDLREKLELKSCIKFNVKTPRRKEKPYHHRIMCMSIQRHTVIFNATNKLTASRED
jgi:hypothetical protein